jgi:hypothetical protein
MVGGYLAGVACVLLVCFYQETINILPVLLIFIACVCFVANRLSPISMSPAVYFAGYLAIVAIVGFYFANALVGAGGTGGIDVALPLTLRAATTNTMLIAASVVLVVAALVRGNVGGLGALSLMNFEGITRFSGWFLALGTVEIFALINSLGLSGLISRPTRFLGRGSSFDSLILMVALAAVVVVAIAFFSTHGFARLYAFVLLSAFVACFISLGSRRLALVPLLILLGFAISRQGRVRILPVFVVAFFSLLLLSLPLHFRGSYEHGLLPYLGSLSTYQFNVDTVATALNNVIAGYKITALSGFTQPPVDLSVLWITLNPISGDSAGWYDVSRGLRLNRYTPYSAMGELINYGPYVLVPVTMGLGVALGLIQRFNTRLLNDNFGKFVAVVALGLVFMFVVQSGQYNLRSVLRYIYLALGIQIVALVLVWVHNSRKSPVERRPPTRLSSSHSG